MWNSGATIIQSVRCIYIEGTFVRRKQFLMTAVGMILKCRDSQSLKRFRNSLCRARCETRDTEVRQDLWKHCLSIGAQLAEVLAYYSLRQQSLERNSIAMLSADSPYGDVLAYRGRGKVLALR